MPKQIRWLFTTPRAEDNEKKYQLDMLNTVIVIAFVTLVAYITLAILQSDQSPLLALGLPTLFLIFIFVWWLLRRGYVYLTRTLLLAFFPVGLTVLIVQSGLGLQNPLINGYLIFIIVATMVLGARSGLLCALATIHVNSVLIRMTPVPVDGGLSLQSLAAYSILNAAAVALLMFLIRGNIDRALGRARSSNDELRHQTDLLRQNQARFAAIFQNATDITLLLDAHGLPFYATPSVTRLLGYAPEDQTTKRFFEYLHPDDQTAVEQVFQTSLAQPHAAIWTQFRSRHADGHWVCLEVCLNNLLDDADIQGVVFNARDISERKQIETELEKQRQHLEILFKERTAQLTQSQERAASILNNSSEAIILLANEGIIQQTNRAFNDLFLCDSDTYFEHPLESLIIPADTERIQQALRLVCTTQAVQRLEVTACRRDGRTVPVGVGLAPLVILKEKTSGIVCNLQDITPYRQAEADLRSALGKERELNELKSRFVSNVSHEFRTPLATILSATETLRDHLDRMNPEERTKRFNKIKYQVDHMVSLLDDTLLMGRLENRQIEVCPERFDVAVFIADITDEFRQMRPTYHLHLVCSTPEVWLTADKKLMRQIVTNLLSNACKYSPDGSTVEIQVELEASQLILAIHDQGIGIPEADQKHIFTAFHRGQNVRTIQGTGLGLAITHRAVEAQGGTITFESRANCGTTFTVRLPLNINPYEPTHSDLAVSVNG